MGMRILVVEDSPTQSKSIQASLERRGMDVDCAGSLQQTIERLKSPGIDVILLDLSLPDSVGIETFYRVRQLETGIPIVVFTSEDNHRQSLEAVRNGAQDYVIKGIAGDASVLRCLQYAVERHRVELALRKEQERLRAIVENSYDAFLSMDSEWRITDWNAQAEQTFGWRSDEVLGQSLMIILPDHLRRQYLRGIAQYFTAIEGRILRTSREIFAVRKDGHEFPIEMGIFRIKEDLDYTYCAFVRDITERKRSNEELERLVQERTEQLTQMNEELRQFAKIASHDLQEPLKTMQGFVHLLSDNLKGKLDRDSQEFLEYIEDGTRRMQNLISSVLIHSHIETDESEKFVTNCNQVIEEAVALLRKSIKDAEAHLEVDRLPDVAVEHSQMVQLFQNLISNAIKYHGEDPPVIHIRAEHDHNQCLFSVRDNCIGIDPIYAEKVFDMFSRLHGKGQYSGTGMGLAICKKIVESHGGQIWVESQLGQGSIFFFTLPAVRKVRRSSMHEGIEILLVEDTPSDVRLTQEALKRCDFKYDLAVVTDGVEAMDYLHRLKASAATQLPDVILLDLNMPRKNGHEVLAEIKADPELKQIPVILLTVSERDEDVMEALKLKMNYYVAKPVTSQKLSALIKSIYEVHCHESAESPDRTDEETHVRLILASNPHTSAVALAKLADDTNERVRCRVAENPHAPSVLLVKLATDGSAEVRLSVGENPNAPPSVLEMLAQDASEDVRLGLSANPHIPEYLLKALAEDENVFVSSNASKSLTARQERDKQSTI
jgi:PAS domain S-box-containing protein